MTLIEVVSVVTIIDVCDIEVVSVVTVIDVCDID